jgi:hypothetical protein
MPTSKPIFFLNLLPEKNMGYLHKILRKKCFMQRKGDEITQFDGTTHALTGFPNCGGTKYRIVFFTAL